MIQGRRVARDPQARERLRRVRSAAEAKLVRAEMQQREAERRREGEEWQQFLQEAGE